MVRGAAHMFFDHPIVGTGVGSLVAVYPRYETFYDGKIVDHVHNDYMELLAETGILGCAVRPRISLDTVSRRAKMLRSRTGPFLARDSRRSYSRTMRATAAQPGGLQSAHPFQRLVISAAGPPGYHYAVALRSSLHASPERGREHESASGERACGLVNSQLPSTEGCSPPSAENRRR